MRVFQRIGLGVLTRTLVFTLFLLCCLSPAFGDMEIIEGDFYLDGERYIARGVEVVSGWPSDRETVGLILDQMVAAGVNAIRMHSGYHHIVFEEAQKRDIYLIAGYPCTWDRYCTNEEILAIIQEYALHQNILAWCIGNEHYSTDLTVPIDYLEDLNTFTHDNDPFGHWTTYANHMVMTSPDVGLNPLLYLLGYRPVDFVDVIAWNAYPLLRALSWDNLVIMWWEDNREEVEEFSPYLAKMMDKALDLYSRWAQNIPEWALQSSMGLGYFLAQYARNAYLQNWDWQTFTFHHKPWILTEWAATDDPAAVENDFQVIKLYEKLFSLDGYMYFNWANVDHSIDGTIDNFELYDTITRLYTN